MYGQAPWVTWNGTGMTPGTNFPTSIVPVTTLRRSRESGNPVQKAKEYLFSLDLRFHGGDNKRR